MGSAVMERAASALVVIAAALGLAGCDLEPCGALDLGAVETRAFDDPASTVIAVSDGKLVKILRSCVGPDCGLAQLEVQRITLPGVPDQLMLTAEGQLTYRIDDAVERVEFDQDGLPSYRGLADEVYEIVGALRGGDWLIYRARGEARELRALYAGDLDQLPTDIPAGFRLGPGTEDLRVAAIGHRHVVARKLLGDGQEELYLIRVVPALHFDHLGSVTRGHALPLGRGAAFRRVILTDGPAPADLGPSDEFQRHVPTDALVIATSGEGADARTLIYSVADTSQIANFAGEVVTSVRPLEHVTGLRPVSPDGTQLAYITPSGALALHDLEDQRSCELRPRAGAKHLLAGFGADGTIYFESKEGGGEEVVYAYDASTRDFELLTDRSGLWRLQAVPALPYFDEDRGEAVPWAIVANNGIHASSAGVTTNHSLDADEISFLPRGGETLWMLEAKPGTEDDDSELLLERVQPELADGRVKLDMDAAPLAVELPAAEPKPFVHAYTSLETRVCVTTSQAASDTTPWATQCSQPDEPGLFLDNGLPVDELGP